MATGRSGWFESTQPGGSRARYAALTLGSTPSQTWAGVVHRPADIRQLSKTPPVRAGGRQGIRTQTLPPGERGYGPSADHPLAPPIGDSARIRTWTRELWRLGCSPTPRCRLFSPVSTSSKTQPPSDLARASCGIEVKTKKAFQGIALEGLFLYECRPFRALRSPFRYRARRYGD